MAKLNWLIEQNPRLLLDHTYHLSERVKRLAGLAVIRSCGDQSYPELPMILARAELGADQHLRLAATWKDLSLNFAQNSRLPCLVEALATQFWVDRRILSRVAVCADFYERSSEACDAIRCVAGNVTEPFYSSEVVYNLGEKSSSPISFLEINGDFSGVAPDWYRQPDLRQFASVIYHDKDYDSLPILADAMEDAGCPTLLRGGKENPLLVHLRSPGPHYRGCWALDFLLTPAARHLVFTSPVG